LALSALAACGPTTDVGQRVLFGPNDVTFPFAESESVRWRFIGQNDYETVRLELRDGTAYTLIRERAEYGAYEFIPINGTPAEDYVVQLVIPSEDEPSVGYHFVLRDDQGFREFVANCGPPSVLDGPCHDDPGYVLTFRNRADLFRHYERVIYPDLMGSNEVGK
jgi:hypothetical protein